MTKFTAESTLHQYQSLVGQRLLSGDENWGLIKEVVVTPYDELNLHIYAHFYIEHTNATKALEFYTLPFFDHWCIAEAIDSKQYRFFRVTDYLRDSTNVHFFDFSEH